MRRRIVAAALVAAATLSLVGVGTASAAPSSAPVSASASAPVSASAFVSRGITIWPTVRRHWWGQSYRFNKWQTQVIAGGVLGAITLGGGWLAIPAGALQWPAQYAIDRGACLQLNRPWVPHPGMIAGQFVPTWYAC